MYLERKVDPELWACPQSKKTKPQKKTQISQNSSILFFQESLGQEWALGLAAQVQPERGLLVAVPLVASYRQA